MDNFLALITSAILIVVTAYFGVRADVRERTAVKELVELCGALPAGDGKVALTAEIERRVKAMAPSSAERANKEARTTHLWKIRGWLLGGAVFYGGAIGIAAFEVNMPQGVVPVVLAALPIGCLMLCVGVISCLRYRRRYL